MTEIKDPAVEQSTTTTEQPAESTVINDEYDEFENDLVGLQPQPKDETDKGKESEKTTQAETETKTVETTETTKADDELSKPDESAEELYPIVVDGTEHKLKMEELIANARQGFDYTQKTQKLADERKKFEENKGNFDNERNLIMLENIALQVGGQKREPVLDEMGDLYDNLVEKYGKDEANKMIANYEPVSDRAEFLKKQGEYQAWRSNAQTVLHNRQLADEENMKNIDSFKTSFKIDNNKMDDMIKEMQNYIGYAVGKGQVPLPKDAFEIFYRGKNYNTLLKAETDKLNAEWETKLKTEKEKLIESMKPGRTFVKQPVTVTKQKQTAEEKSVIDQLEEEMITESY